MTWNSKGTAALGAFDILGTPLATPEPSSLALLGVVLLAFMGILASKKLLLARARQP